MEKYVELFVRHFNSRLLLDQSTAAIYVAFLCKDQEELREST